MSDDPLTASQLASVYAQTFGTANGLKTLDDLSRMFDQDTFDPNPYVAARLAGARLVILHIRRMVAAARSQARRKDPRARTDADE